MPSQSEERKSFSGELGQWQRAPRSSPRLSPPFPSTTCALPTHPSSPRTPSSRALFSPSLSSALLVIFIVQASLSPTPAIL